MRGIPTLCAAVLMLSCGSEPVSSYVIRNPGHPSTVVIECEERAYCYARANTHCPTGYQVLDSGIDVERNSAAQALENYSATQQKRIPNNYTRLQSVLHIMCTRPA